MKHPAGTVEPLFGEKPIDIYGLIASREEI